LAADAQEVLGEGHAGEDVDALLERGAEQLGQNNVIEALATYTLAVLVERMSHS
jgi:urease gamma subunit